MLLAGLTSAHADNGTLSVSNVRNAVPGYTGSFDIVLSGAEVQYKDFQLDITFPEGLTYDSWAAGPLLDGHESTPQAVAGEDNTERFIVTTGATKMLTAKNGTLLTVYFTVAADATGTLTGGTLSGIRFSNPPDGSTSYALTDNDFSVDIISTVTLDENDIKAPVASTGSVDVVVNRTLAAGMWNTIVLPFDMTNAQLKSAFGADVSLASFGGYTTDGDGNISVQFTTSDALAAHTPYIIKVSADKTSFSASEVAITEADNNLTVNKGTNNKPKAMIGTYVAETTIPSNSLFLSSDNQFKYSKGNSKLKAFRAYFTFTDFDYEADGAAPAVVLDIFDMTTGIRSVERSAAAEGTDGYDLGGRRQPADRKGIRIVNGKKYVNK